MPFCPSCNDTFPGGKFCPKDGARLVPDEEGAAGQGDGDLLGQVVADRFRIVRLLGSGGMGTVYEAEHTFIKKKVALKLLRSEITSNPEAVARFQREALAASTIGHENIVAIDDFGRLSDGQVYLTMEYLEGEPLNSVLARGEMPIPRLIDVAIQVCRGLAVAHAEGIVHRDMKPENIFLAGEEGTAKILDFGIAKVTGNDTNENLTKTGAVFGTPNYMCPEQALGTPVDTRADIYSMGVILYEMLCGTVPFQSESFLAVLTQHVTATPAPPSQLASRHIPDELEQVVLRAMAKEPDDRYQTVDELSDALAAARDGVAYEPVETPSTLALAPDVTGPGVRTGPGIQVAGPDDLTVIPVKETATAGEIMAAMDPPRRRTGLIVAVAALAVVLGAGGVLAYFHLSKPDPAGGPNVVAAKADDEDEPKEPEEKPEAKQEAQPAPKKVASGHVEVILDSQPTGAYIYHGKKRIGRTPHFLSVPRGEVLKLSLHRPGYRRIPVEVADDEKKMVVPLVRLRRVKHPRPPRQPRPPKAKKPGTVPTKKKKPPTSDHDHDSDHDRGSDHSSHDDQPIAPEGY